MKAVYFGIFVIGALIIYEAIQGLKGTPNPASAAGNTTTSSANSPTGSLAYAPPNGSINTILPAGFGAGIGSILGQAGAPPSWLSGLLTVLSQENSQLDPNAVNPVSVNGEHATGLFQMLPSTFAANAQPGCTDILNPVCNTESAINYIKAQYGSPYQIPNLGTPSYQGY